MKLAASPNLMISDSGICWGTGRRMGPPTFSTPLFFTWEAGGQESLLAGSSPLTSSRPGLAPWEDPAWRAGFGGFLACLLPSESSCLKCLLFLSNFLFSLLSLLALAIGLWGLAVKGSLGSSWGSPLPADPMLGLVLGGLAVSVVSLAGCLGALCENTFLLRCFSGGVLAFLVLEAVVGALVVALWGQLQDGLEHVLRLAITHYQDDPDLCFLIDQVQLGLQCCGAASYQDWQWNLYFNCSSPGVQACSLPASCCVDPWEGGASVNDQCGFGALGLDEDAAQRVVHLEGCGPPLLQWLRSNIRTVGCYAIVVVLVQGVELLLAIQLVRALTVHKGAEGIHEAARLAPIQPSGAFSAPNVFPPLSLAEAPPIPATCACAIHSY
ncbi:TPA: Tetraspanin 10-like [Bos taurus]|nr:TPA: Tetraspanin 10-like [Bos taurus]